MDPSAPPPVLRMRPVRPRERIRDRQVLKMGHLATKPDRLDHRFAFHVAVLVVRGGGDWRCDDGPVHRVAPGTLFFLWPGPRFRFGPDPDTTWDEYHLCLDGPALEDWTRQGWLSRADRVWRIERPGPVVTRLKRIRDLVRDGTPGSTDRAALAAELLLCDLHYQRAGGDGPAADPLVTAALATCRDHLAEGVSFPALAAELGVSYSLLRQRLRSITGLPPARLLARLRCEQAQHLLATGDDSVREIGEAVGIDDPYAFSRTFKRHVGVSPATWRAHFAPWRG